MANLTMEIKPTDTLYTKPANSTIYQLAGAFLNGMGEGKDSNLYKKIIHSGVDQRNATGSSLLLSMATEKILPKEQRIASLDDMVKMLKKDPSCFNKIYSYTTEILLYSPTSENEENTQIEKSLHGIADSREYDCENPLRFTNLTITRDTNSQNPYGVMFKTTPSTRVGNDKRFAYSGNNWKKIDFDGINIMVYTGENGLSGLYVNGGDITAGNNNLAFSRDKGQMVIASAEKIDF